MQGSSFRFGATDDEISDQFWRNPPRSTVLSTLIDDDGNSGTFKNLKTKTYGVEHAEDVWLRTLQDGVNQGKYSYNGVNEVILNVTASPCTSVVRNGLPITSEKLVGCTEELIALAGGSLTDGNFDYYFKIIVICEHYYQPKGFGPGVKDASIAAVQAMRDAGIACAVERE